MVNEKTAGDAPRKTRDRILDSALNLFNRQGTASVTTNHIAVEMEISPGNLYYHFRNKREIIRELVERWIGQQGELLAEIGEIEKPVERLIAYLRRNIELGWEMRFFLREMLPLIQTDEELQQRYRDVHRQRRQETVELVGSLIEEGVLREPESGSILSDLFRSFWILSHFWVAEFDLLPGAFVENALDDALRSALRLYQPLMTETTIDSIRRFDRDF